MKILFFFLMLTGHALAQNFCEHKLTLGNATIQIQNANQVIAQEYSIRRTDPANGRCSTYRLFFSKGDANSYQREAENTSGQKADYNLHRNISMIGTLKDVNDAISPSEFIESTTNDENIDYSGTFYISVPGFSSQGNLAAGTYSDNILIRVYSVANNGSTILEQVKPFSINLLVNTNMAISIVDEGGAHNESSTAKVLNFGNLQTNQELGADITVTSNTAYQVRLASINNGNLKRNSSLLPYQFRMNGANYSLAGSANAPVTVATGTANGTTPTRYNVKVKITGDTTNLPAGNYEDTITITLMAN